MIGQTISHYRITRQLGMGGMGVVYAGEDPRLNRPVALKFVPEELANDPHTLERLRSEARTVSALNHPNICTIYDVGEYQGRPFFVMELLSGQTLRDRIVGSPLRVHEALDIGIQVADALHWAHSKDVIHRDIKPANLFLVDHGQVKVLDFGLAKNIGGRIGSDATLAPTIDLTAVGVALGTVAYMSPEQVSGETLDRRTDLFSLGVVLYECLTGRQPFQGKTSAVVLASILTQVPIAPMTINPEIPARLQEVIHNCLEKDREMRYQDAASLRADLKRIKRDLESGALRAASIVPAAGSVFGKTEALSVAETAVVPLASAPSASPSAVTTAVEPSRSGGSRRGLMIGLGAIALVAVVTAIGMMVSDESRPPAADSVQTTASPPPAATPPPDVNPPAAVPPAVVPPARTPADQARFDAAIVDANRLLAAGDADGATRSLNVAREIDPAAPQVTDLSARVVEQYRMEANRARRADNQPGQRAPSSPRGPGPEPSPVPTPAPRPNPPAQGVTVPPPSAPPQTVAPITSAPEPPAQPVARAPVEPPPPAPAPRPEPPAIERRPPAASAPAVEDDDTAIRRVVATYARAIENKDLGLFKLVKPNMSADEQRRIEAGFRAVTTQRVAVTIQTIEHRGQDAVVRLSRHDVIQAGGRQQTSDSQQSLTLTKGSSGWVIREIGR